ERARHRAGDGRRRGRVGGGSARGRGWRLYGCRQSADTRTCDGFAARVRTRGIDAARIHLADAVDRGFPSIVLSDLVLAGVVRSGVVALGATIDRNRDIDAVPAVTELGTRATRARSSVVVAGREGDAGRA